MSHPLTHEEFRQLQQEAKCAVRKGPPFPDAVNIFLMQCSFPDAVLVSGTFSCFPHHGHPDDEPLEQQVLDLLVHADWDRMPSETRRLRLPDPFDVESMPSNLRGDLFVSDPLTYDEFIQLQRAAKYTILFGGHGSGHATSLVSRFLVSGTLSCLLERLAWVCQRR